MAQGFCTLTKTGPRPFTLYAGATAASSVRAAALTPVWSDGTTDTAWAAGVTAVSAYDDSKTIDSTAAVWWLVAIKGSGVPKLIKEADVLAGTADTTLGGTWAPLARIEGDDLDRIPQA